MTEQLIEELNMKNESGFTLIETLLVLLVTSLLILLPTLSIDKMVESLEIDLFFREMTSNITLMQNHAILAGKKTSVEFYPIENNELIRFKVANNHPLNRTLYLYSPYYWFNGSEPRTFDFKSDTGNISASNTIRFNTTQGMYKLTYLMGSGRFDIKKDP